MWQVFSDSHSTGSRGCQMLALSQVSLPPSLPSLWDLKPRPCPPHLTSPPPSLALNELLHHCLTWSGSSKHACIAALEKWQLPLVSLSPAPRPIFHECFFINHVLLLVSDFSSTPSLLLSDLLPLADESQDVLSQVTLDLAPSTYLSTHLLP